MRANGGRRIRLGFPRVHPTTPSPCVFIRSKRSTVRRATCETGSRHLPSAPADLATIRAEIRDVLANQTNNARKALFENLIYEIEIIGDDTGRPAFRLPLGRNHEGASPRWTNPY